MTDSQDTKFDKFWEIYINEDIVDNYEAVKTVFSEELGSEIGEKYDIGEVLTEFIGHYKSAKEFEKIIAFTKVMKAHNPRFFSEVSAYYNEFLVRYYCYHDDKEKLWEPVKDFLDDPLKDYDLLLKSLRRLVYYGYTDFAEKLIERTYPALKEASGYMLGAESDLAIMQFHLELEKVYDHYQKNQAFEWSAFKEMLERYDLEVREGAITEEGLERDISEIKAQFSAELAENDFRVLEKLEKGFLKYMKAYEVSFAASGAIWNHFHRFWTRERVDQQGYFELEEEDLKAYVKNQSGMILDYRFESVLVLWGSSYVYDFLRKAALIEEALHDKAKGIIKQLKKALMGENLTDLWEYAFVHRWKRAESVTELEEKAEKEKFEAFYSVKNEEIDTVEYFFSPSKEEKQARMQRLLGGLSTQGIEPQTHRTKTVQRSSPKIGRNEKVTVRYKDGVVKEGVKYKVVMKDLESGDCELV